jgi:tetratricopeptide (TPR) repeat protein
MRQQVPAQMNRIDAMEGAILEWDGQFDKAMAIYTAALLRAPDDTDLLYDQALLAERMGRFEQAEANLLRIVEMEPENVSALNSLGFTLADHGPRYQEAYEYIQRALALRPDSAAILDSMGWVLYRLGRMDEALDYLRRSLDIRQDQEVAAHLGEVLWMRGEHTAARTVWRQALERAPDDKMILDVMKRFGQ